ncbi:O-antigen ligase family protein [Exiguobacterium mexicanum]|uniref:O-antigen ligase family protein n=1 Tax=Exiguobacterium mexicanum TaxID=340146 RepID=UPI0037BE691C
MVLNELLKKEVPVSKVFNITFLVGIYFLPLFSFLGYMEAQVISIVLALLIVFLIRSDYFYLVLPMMIFYYSQLVLPGGIALFRVYTILFLIKIISEKKITTNKRLLIPFTLMSLYCVIVVSKWDPKTAFTIILDLFVVIIYISSFLTNKENIVNFFKWFSIATFSTVIYGIWSINSGLNSYYYINGVWLEVTRFTGTFGDPNYFGFYINIAIFSLLILGNFKKTIKVILLMIFYFALIATVSMTGLICNLLGLFILMSFKNGSIFKKNLIVSSMLIISLILYNLSMNYSIPVLSDTAERINNTINNFTTGNFVELSSDRNVIWSNHLQYYFEQPIYNILFGGNYITDYGFDLNKFSSVTHNALIDMLLNFGLIGFMVLISTFLFSTIIYLKMYIQTKENFFLVLVMSKYVWLFYSFSLSMFPSWKFNLFFLF